MAEAGPRLWEPTAEQREQAAITRFTRWVESSRGVDLPSTRASGDGRSTAVDDLWAAIWEYVDVQASVPYDRVLGRRAMPAPSGSPAPA